MTWGDDIRRPCAIDDLAPRNIRETTEMGTTWGNRCRWMGALLALLVVPAAIARGGRTEKDKAGRVPRSRSATTSKFARCSRRIARDATSPPRRGAAM